MAHICEAGISFTASVNTIKARPVPEALWEGVKERQENSEYDWHMMYCNLGMKGEERGRLAKKRVRQKEC